MEKAILMSRQRFWIIWWIDDEFIRSFKLSDEAETRKKLGNYGLS